MRDGAPDSILPGPVLALRLSGPDGLAALLGRHPGARLLPGGELLIPLDGRSAEELLADCLSARARIAGSRMLTLPEFPL